MPYQPYRIGKKKTGRGLGQFLGELELAVMEIIWQSEPVSVREVQERLLRGKRNLAYTTVMTILGRLKDKGWVTAEKQGRAFLYRAAFPRQEAEGKAIGGVVRALLEDFGEVAVAQFLREIDAVDPDQLRRLGELARLADQDDHEYP